MEHGDALSTQDEAIQVREYLKSRKEIDSLDKEVRVASCPTQYDDFNAEGWWESGGSEARSAGVYETG